VYKVVEIYIMYYYYCLHYVNDVTETIKNRTGKKNMITKKKKQNDQQKRKAVMIGEHAHKALHEWCKERGYIMGRVVDRIIVDYVRREKEGDRSVVDAMRAQNDGQRDKGGFITVNNKDYSE
jgi:hypothetical protein